jgi:soluble lytic murein transglycosylase-like protein
LTHYRGSKSAAFAAYNSGEQTVDAWQERRNFDDPLIFIELMPYTETRTYVKNVWRNESIFAYFKGSAEKED